MNSPISQLLRRRTGAVRAAALAALALTLASTAGCALSLNSSNDNGERTPAASAAPTAEDGSAPSGAPGGGLTRAGDVASPDQSTAAPGGMSGASGTSGTDSTAVSSGEGGAASGLCATLGDGGADAQEASRTMRIDDVGGVKRITGKADTLTVEGVGVVVHIDAVDSLVMNGTGDTVCAGSVGSVSFGESSVGSSVVYEGADPVVADAGTGSVTARR